MAKKIKVALVGIGNCFSGLIQGIEYYNQNTSQQVIGIIHEILCDYTIHDIDFVACFDDGENKIGKSINEAIYEYPNMVDWIPKDKMPNTEFKVYESPALDGVGIWVENRVKPIQSGKNTPELEKEIKNILKETGVALLPGSDFGFSIERPIVRLSFTDFNGQEFMKNLKGTKKLDPNAISEFAPKIVEGTKKLKGWVESN